MDIIKIIKSITEIGREDGLKGVLLTLLIISCTVLFFSPACLFFILFKRNLYVDIDFTVILILILSAMLFFIIYFLSSITMPFFYLIRCIRIENYENIDTKNSKVYTFIITMFSFLILSAVLLIGYIVKKFYEFSDITQFGIKIFLISIIIIIVIFILMWIATVLINIRATKVRDKFLKETERIENETSKTYGKMPNI